MMKEIKKQNLQFVGLIIIISFFVWVLTFSYFQKQMPLILPNQRKIVHFSIDNEDLFEGIGDNDISYSCSVAVPDEYRPWDPNNISGYGILCEGTRTINGGRCLCVVVIQWNYMLQNCC